MTFIARCFRHAYPASRLALGITKPAAWRRGLLAVIAWALCATAQAASVLIITSSPVQPGKFRMLADLAEPHHIRIDARYIEKLPAETDSSLFRGYDLVVFDAPRDHIRDAIRARLANALPALSAPAIWIGTAKTESSGIPEQLAARLHAYYVNGSKLNFQRMFQMLEAHFAGRSWAAVAPPVVFPTSAVYHPAAPAGVFSSTEEYLAWKKFDPARPQPVIAIAMHQQYVSAGQTAFIDDLIGRIEQEGAMPLAFYSPVMETDAMTAMLAPKNAAVADVLINTQIMLNPEGRKKEFESMGIPVVQAMPYRKGDIAAWQADPHGVALMDIPFYLAQAEYAGVTDIMIAAATRQHDDQVVPIGPQAAAVVGKAMNLIRLRQKRNADKNVAIMFWNYPAGEKNLSASYMNLPRSLDATLAALRDAGYATSTPGSEQLTRQLQRLLTPSYRPPDDNAALEALIADGLAELFPLAEYRAWTATLPAAVQAAMRSDWGDPARSTMVVHRGGRSYFAIPRLKLGNVVLMPQAPRGERGGDKEKALYHSTTASPPPFYLASYLWLRKNFAADALIHFGTHGTQEWLPGKERGLSVSDYPLLAIGDVPVIYPYIVDNVGEATQAKRRGRAVTISHQTPPFAPAGLHDVLTRMHDLLHEWMAQDEGAVRQKQRQELVRLVRQERIDKDMGWSDQRLDADFPGFVAALHDHLHELAQTAQPMGLHTFGKGAEAQWRLGTVMMMLGKDFWAAAAAPGEEPDEVLAADYRRLTETSPFKLLRRHIIDGAPATELPAALHALIENGRRWYTYLGATSEMDGLLAALEGRYIPTSYGGDPIKNSDSLPTGRNLYPFDPSRMPTKAAWEAGKASMEQLIAAHLKQSGRAPRKLTFSLWSVETMRHQGMLEAQALWGLGVEPVWDQGGRVVDVKLVPRGELKRPRVDIVLSATGLYRDHFPNLMKHLAKAARLAAEADESDNPVAANAREISTRLLKQGWPRQAAVNAGQTRIFASESGKYGTGLDDAALATDTWNDKAEGDRKLAQLYLARMQYAYGPDEADWGKKAHELSNGKPGNLYADHLKGTEGAVLSRTSNLYGMLTTDDPFQYLGGIALAVRELDGKAPELYISNLRDAGAARIEGAAQFLAKELATRNFHPGYIKGLMNEGYAGTLQVLDSMNNFAGWTSVAREIVRDDQWQEFADVYVRDKHKLGLDAWFERENPHALAQTIERMLEAARHGYWKADGTTVEELKARYRDLAKRFDVRTDNEKLAAYAGLKGSGVKNDRQAEPNVRRDVPVSAPLPSPARPASQSVAPAERKPEPENHSEHQSHTPPETISGIKLEKMPQQQIVDTLSSMLAAAIGLIILIPLIGAWRQWRKGAPA